jgi:pimeloyl-ACP methyl ester carboxylesterase
MTFSIGCPVIATFFLAIASPGDPADGDDRPAAPAPRDRAVRPASAAIVPPGATGAKVSFDLSGLAMRRSYTRGKVPVVFVHGLGLDPTSWARMINSLESDPALRDHYQFWTFRYETGAPIPYSASLLRRALGAARRQFDPDRSDPAFDRMVLVGHSLGGLLSKMMVQKSKDQLWDQLSASPIAALGGSAGERTLLQQSFVFAPQREVRRVVFIAVPHRGSPLAMGLFGRIGSKIVPAPGSWQMVRSKLVAENGRARFSPLFEPSLAPSAEQLASGHPLLAAIGSLEIDPAVKLHSIVAELGSSSQADATDGLVPYASAHLEGVASERIIHTGHYCLDHPDVIAETRRILFLHLEEPPPQITRYTSPPPSAAGPSARS